MFGSTCGTGTALYPVPSGFTRQEDMSGVVTINGESIALSNSPVLLMDDAPLLLPPTPPTDFSSAVHYFDTCSTSRRLFNQEIYTAVVA